MDTPVPEVSIGRFGGIEKSTSDQAISIVPCGLLHVQTAVSLHTPATGRILLCGKVDEVGTVYP
ncbi:hypothetical protein [Amycolatopsis kentuckyensis]|uniref:hypothetical protein n=1 Tax=Amycolatopsis kentuckyensis TaxID=218823 RepID=UPI003562CAC0